MTHGARKAKGRRLQVTVAEAIARRCDLTIAAVPPTKPGERNGVVWVPEHQSPDLLVRMMGQAGADVGLLSPAAVERVAFLPDSPPSPLWIECKNNEAWDFGASLWRTGVIKFVEQGMEQAKQARPHPGFRPVLVLGKNKWPPIVVWENDCSRLAWSKDEFDVILQFGIWAATALDSFLNLLVTEVKDE